MSNEPLSPEIATEHKKLATIKNLLLIIAFWAAVFFVFSFTSPFHVLDFKLRVDPVNDVITKSFNNNLLHFGHSGTISISAKDRKIMITPAPTSLPTGTASTAFELESDPISLSSEETLVGSYSNEGKEWCFMAVHKNIKFAYNQTGMLSNDASGIKCVAGIVLYSK